MRRVPLKEHLQAAVLRGRCRRSEQPSPLSGVGLGASGEEHGGATPASTAPDAAANGFDDGNPGTLPDMEGAARAATRCRQSMPVLVCTAAVSMGNAADWVAGAATSAATGDVDTQAALQPGPLTPPPPTSHLRPRLAAAPHSPAPQGAPVHQAARCKQGPSQPTSPHPSTPRTPTPCPVLAAKQLAAEQPMLTPTLAPARRRRHQGQPSATKAVDVKPCLSSLEASPPPPAVQLLLSPLCVPLLQEPPPQVLLPHRASTAATVAATAAAATAAVTAAAAAAPPSRHEPASHNLTVTAASSPSPQCRRRSGIGATGAGEASHKRKRSRARAGAHAADEPVAMVEGCVAAPAAHAARSGSGVAVATAATEAVAAEAGEADIQACGAEGVEKGGFDAAKAEVEAEAVAEMAVATGNAAGRRSSERLQRRGQQAEGRGQQSTQQSARQQQPQVCQKRRSQENREPEQQQQHEQEGAQRPKRQKRGAASGGSSQPCDTTTDPGVSTPLSGRRQIRSKAGVGRGVGAERRGGVSTTKASGREPRRLGSNGDAGDVASSDGAGGLNGPGGSAMGGAHGPGGLPAAAGGDGGDPRVSTYTPPASPYGLLEEVLYDNPWRLLVACILLNRTTGRQVRHVIGPLWRAYPDPWVMSAAQPAALEPLLRPLGLQRVRAATLVRFSSEYLTKQWRCPTQLHGCGRYAADAYWLFCRGAWRSVQPADKDLRRYRDWLASTGGEGSGLEHETLDAVLWAGKRQQLKV